MQYNNEDYMANQNEVRHPFIEATNGRCKSVAVSKFCTSIRKPKRKERTIVCDLSISTEEDSKNL